MRADSPHSSNATGLRIGVVISGYHRKITQALRDGAIEAFRAAGGRERDRIEIASPGAFELTALARALAVDGRVHAVVALGCIIAGETRHDRYLASAVAHGLTAITVHTGVPVTFGVLTCKNVKQARERAGGKHGNKGAEAMIAAVETVRAIQGISPRGRRSRSVSDNGASAPARNGRSTGAAGTRRTTRSGRKT